MNAMKKKQFPNYLSVCVIAKDEARYFPEWIEYHKMMGVDKFYVYDNESSDGTYEVLKPYIDSGLVEYRFFPGKKRQLPAYIDCVRRHKYDSKYIAFIDMDEFIVPIKHKTIPEFLESVAGDLRAPELSGVEINWLIYGSGGHEKRIKGLAIEQFRDHSLPDYSENRTVKTIANPRKIWTSLWRFGSTHKPVIISGRYVDSHGNKISGVKTDYWKRPPQHDVIRVNHYAIRSKEEFMDRIKRGDARFGDAQARTMNKLKLWDKNDIKGDKTMEPHAKRLRKIINS